MAKKKEDKFDMLARIIKEEGEEIRKELQGEFKKGFRTLEKKIDEKADAKKMDEGFTEIKRRLDVTIQPQLDNHAHRLKTLEYKGAKL